MQAQTMYSIPAPIIQTVFPQRMCVNITNTVSITGSLFLEAPQPPQISLSGTSLPGEFSDCTSYGNSSIIQYTQIST